MGARDRADHEPAAREAGDGVTLARRRRSDKIYFNRTSRDLKRIDIVAADTTPASRRVVVAERSNTYIEIQPLRLIDGGKQLIHWSERDGWGHYYLLRRSRQDDPADHVRRVRRPPASSASTRRRGRCTSPRVGREPSEDPYFPHFYRANIDTGEIKLLNPGNASHAVVAERQERRSSSTTRRASTSAPESVLYDTMGNKVMDLEKTDVSALLEAGFKYPGAVHRQGRRRHHGPLRQRCTSRSTSIRRRSTRSSCTSIRARRPSR